ncbi:MAG: hypothetical protein JXA14_26040 [Anaerolineae bacterium]|nr:hypothetical protein [Anaerolineae bacterium]
MNSFWNGIKKHSGKALIVLGVVLALIGGLQMATLMIPDFPPAGEEAIGIQAAKERFGWLVAKRATVTNETELQGDVTMGEDLTVTGDVTVGDTLDVNGDIDLDGDGFDVNITAGFSIDADAASNINTSAGDITVEAATGSVTIKGDEAAADAIKLDANETVTSGLDIDVGSISGVTIDGGLTDIGGGTGGTADGDDDLLVAGDLEVDDTLDVDGDIDLDGDGFDVNVTAGFSIDADAASNINVAGAGIDLTLESEEGSVVIKGDEAVATAITLDANEAVTTGVTIQVGSVGGLNITGGLTNIGGGTFSTADGDDDLGVQGDLEINGTLDADADSNLGTDAGDTVMVIGDVVINGLRDGASGYDNFLEITGDITGTASGAKTYGLLIEMSRPATADNDGGDCDDAALKIRIDNDADGNYYGYVLRGADIQAKNDNSGDSGIHNHVTTLSGASITAQTDSGTGEPYTTDAYGLQVNVTANGRVTNTLISADIRMFRQAATEPATEYVVRVRNSNTSGTGVDAGIAIVSDGSGETDDFDYGLDMTNADINTADIRLSNGETIENTLDGTITVTVASNGRFAVSGGNLVVGDYPPSLTLNGEDAYIEGNLEVDGTFRHDGEADFAVGPVIISNGLFLPSFSDYEVSDGEVLTPTVTTYNLDSSGNVTITLAASCTDGQPLFLVGDDANTIIVSTTNTRTPSGAAVDLTQYDGTLWMCVDSEWILISDSGDNQ